jgi:hypothetical protein
VDTTLYFWERIAVNNSRVVVLPLEPVTATLIKFLNLE